MNGSQASRQAAIRMANDQEQPGDTVLLDTYCPCLWCCANGGRLVPSLLI